MHKTPIEVAAWDLYKTLLKFLNFNHKKSFSMIFLNLLCSDVNRGAAGLI